jgi:molecular chaperone HscB
VTHFDVFGLPARHALDAAALEKRHRELALEHHPDRHQGGDARERRLAVERTTALNDAYRVLKDPARRAFYLLALAGVDLDRADAGGPKDMPLEFLEEVMDLREQLTGAKRANDAAKVLALAAQVETKRSEALTEAVEGLDALARDAADRAALTKASHQLARVRYFTRFLEEAEEDEEAL